MRDDEVARLGPRVEGGDIRHMQCDVFQAQGGDGAPAIGDGRGRKIDPGKVSLRKCQGLWDQVATIASSQFQQPAMFG